MEGWAGEGWLLLLGMPPATGQACLLGSEPGNPEWTGQESKGSFQPVCDLELPSPVLRSQFPQGKMVGRGELDAVVSEVLTD